eukprot:TRINITY_DN26830_c0_g1_i1.p1 TRINITY_DN26830_c0_g1~~TRINITY_DN26830_c0_g1_i1.p1  ORF type:complete len:154 (-),score=20.96 TRINITY_DN26830_c0_g1_i1:135-596(-)
MGKKQALIPPTPVAYYFSNALGVIGSSIRLAVRLVVCEVIYGLIPDGLKLLAVMIAGPLTGRALMRLYRKLLECESMKALFIEPPRCLFAGVPYAWVCFRYAGFAGGAPAALSIMAFHAIVASLSLFLDQSSSLLKSKKEAPQPAEKNGKKSK